MVNLMSEKDDYYMTKLGRIEEHIDTAERQLDKMMPHDCGKAEVNAMLALALALLEIGTIMGELREDVSVIKAILQGEG